MRQLLVLLLLTLSTSSTFAQYKHILVRVTPINNETVTIEKLKQLADKEQIVLLGLLTDGSGLLLIGTDAASWKPQNTAQYMLKSFPMAIDYNLLCKIAKNGLIPTSTFIQYNTYITKFNVQRVPELQNAHYNYLKQLKNVGSVLLEGHFNNDDGGLLLIQGTIGSEVVNADPTIRSGFIIPEILTMSLSNVSSCD